MICLRASYKKTIREHIYIFLASLKSMKKGVVSGVGFGFGSISQRYGSKDPDPDQNVTFFLFY